MKYGKLAFMALAATLLVPAPKAEACFDRFGNSMSGFLTMPFMLGAGIATAGFMGSKLFGGGFEQLFQGLGKKEKKKKKLVAPCAFFGLFQAPSKKAKKVKKVRFAEPISSSYYYDYQQYSYSSGY